MNKNWKKLAALALSSMMCMSAVAGFASCGDKPDQPKPDAPKTYTYRTSFSASPTTWNPHTWESNDDSQILGYTTMGFYDVQLNAAKDGYDWVCEMASALPVDVTSSYVGKYGVKAGDEGKVWKIALNEKAVWEDGTKITADDYVYSMQQQLDPAMLNRRSDSYTSGTFSVYGAKNYLYSNTKETYETLASLGYEAIADAVEAGEDIYVDCWNFWNAAGYVDAEGNEVPQWVSINDTTVYDTPDAWVAGEAEDAFSGASLVEDYGVYLETPDYSAYIAAIKANEHLGYGWEGDGTNANSGVGVFKTGDYEITIALNTEIDAFNIKYNLTSNWLVNKDLYEKCKVTVGDLVSSTYCTTLENTISYGPYKLSSYVFDQYYTLEKNDAWYGYTDGNHEGQFQTTKIDYTYVSGASAKSTNKQLFMTGKLDDYSLDGSEMADYGTSKYLYCSPESYTYQLFMNTDFASLSSEDTDTVNHSVISIPEFRKALSFAISRLQYCSTFDPASQPGFGVLNYMYVIDPDTGATYRDTEAAKRVSLSYAGFTEQKDGSWIDHNGEKYEDIEEAYEAISGYDVGYARDLFQQAYDKAKQQGIYKDGTPVVITFGTVGEASENRIKLINMFNEMFAAAMPENTFASVKLEHYGYATADQFWEALKGGTLDMAFAGWGGSAMDPWGIIYSCYIDPANSNNYKFDVVSKTISLTIDGTTACMYDWCSWLNNNQNDDDYVGTNLFTKLGTLSKASTDFKVKVLAECELAQLNTTCNVPIFYSYVNALKSAKYNNGSDTFVNSMIGFGGIRHITYNYDDAAWDEFVASKDGNLETFYKG